jgi:tetratricopeptide (TPR) repeat protein
MIRRLLLCLFLIMSTMPVVALCQSDSSAADTTDTENDYWDWLYVYPDDSTTFQDSLSVADQAKLLIDLDENYDSAIVLLNNYLPLDSLDTDLWYLLGFAYDRKDNLALASKYYHKSISLDSTNWAPYRDMAYLFDIFAEYDSMNIYMRHAVDYTLEPESLYYDFGYSFDMLDQKDSALVYYHKALESDSLDSDALLNIGAIWGSVNVDSSMIYTRRSLDINSNAPQGCYNYGILLASKDRPAEAVDYFQKTLALDTTMVAAKLQLGQTYEVLGDSDMARLYFQEFVDTAPQIYLDDINRIKAKLQNY